MRALNKGPVSVGLLRVAFGLGLLASVPDFGLAAERAADSTASIPAAAAMRGVAAAMQFTDVPAPLAAPSLGFDSDDIRSAPANAMAATEPGATASPLGKNTDSTPAQPVVKPDQTLVAADIAQAIAAFVPAETGGGRIYPLASLTRRQQRASIAAFYVLRDNAPVWIADGAWTTAARAMIDRMAHAADDGLDLAGYAVPATPGSGAADLAKSELALSEAVAAYGFQASGGRIDPSKIADTIGDKPAVADAVHVLTEVAIAADPATVLAAYNPAQPGYAALRRKLIELRQPEHPSAQAPIGPGPALRIGMRDPRVSLIRSRFRLGAATQDESGDSVYDTIVASRVAVFQRANGIQASGILNARTVAALSGTKRPRSAALESEIVSNMERWRWLPRDLGTDYVEVNVPAFRLSVVEDGAEIHSSRVIVGKTDTPTPLFSNAIQYLTINPYWYVPQSIIKKEMMPHLAANPGYLAQHGYEVTYHGDTMSVRQPPGPRNALGHIVFWFPNNYDVYLHDTSSRSLFGNSWRSESHGCVRVDQPFKLAELVLRGQGGLTEDKLEAMIGTTEHWLTLPARFPIHIVYFTASVDDRGHMETSEDIYGYSQRVKEALNPAG